jgi:hypothetical protein
MKTASQTDLAEIDNFCDALWLEDGLAKATLDSYRSDLGRLSLWLANKPTSLARSARNDAERPSSPTFPARPAPLASALSVDAAPLLPLATRPRPHRRRPDAETGQPGPALAPAQGDVGKADRAACSTPPISTPRSACATAPCSKRSTPPACAFPNWSVSNCTKSASTTGVLRATRQGQQGAPGAARRTSHRLAEPLPERSPAGNPQGPAERRPVRHRPVAAR